MYGLISVFAVCTMLLGAYEELLVGTTHIHYSILEFACSKLISIKYMIPVGLLKQKIPCRR